MFMWGGGDGQPCMQFQSLNGIKRASVQQEGINPAAKGCWIHTGIWSKEENILKMLEARFLTVREGSYKSEKGQNQNESYDGRLALEILP